MDAALTATLRLSPLAANKVLISFGNIYLSIFMCEVGRLGRLAKLV